MKTSIENLIGISIILQYMFYTIQYYITHILQIICGAENENNIYGFKNNIYPVLACKPDRWFTSVKTNMIELLKE